MRTLYVLAALALALPAYAEDVCNPVCADQPPQCCNVQADTFLAEQCTGITSDLVHFRVTDGTAWIDQRTPATFTVSGLSGSTQLGNSGVFQFTIGTSTASARFQIVDSVTPVHVIGQCVTVVGNTYTPGLPSLVVVAGRALQVLNKTLFCREEGVRDLLCFQVKGQVKGPFEAGGFCDPDRVEYACGVVG
jgi:hypothetical protein